MKNTFSSIMSRSIFLLSFLLAGYMLSAQNKSFLSFDGTNDYARYPADATLETLNGARNYTLEAWVYVPTGATAGGNFFRRTHQFVIYFSTNNRLAIGIYYKNDEKYYYYQSKDNVLTNDTWHHIAIVRDNSKAPYLHMYVDGVDQISASKKGYALVSSNTKNLYIGDDGNKGHYLKVYIDEIRLENVAISPSDLHSGRTDNQYIPDGHTAALFHFNEESGQYTKNEATNLDARLGETAAGDDAEPLWIKWNAISSNEHLPLAHEWAGKTGTGWATADNWDGEIPTSSDDVIVPSGLSDYPVISVTTNADCHNLVIATGAQLTIASDSTGNGSFIVSGTTSGNVTVQRYIKKFTSNDVNSPGNGWHEIGCPVTSMPIDKTDWDPTYTGTKNDLYYWSETENKWKNYRNTAFDFTDDKGYLVANDEDLTHVFTGTLKNDNLPFTDLSKSKNGWHLLGNPYPSALTWGDGNWQLDHVMGNAKIWDENRGNYTDVSSGGIIPSTNGFFVQVTSGTNSLTIPAADRVHKTQNNYKNTLSTQKETLRFKVTNDANHYYDECTLGFKADATEGCDNAFDSHKLFSIVSTAPSLWTVSNGEDFSTNYLPETATAYDVPLHFRAGVNSVYHLTIKGADSFDNTGLVLEDLQTGKKIDLNHTDSYDFSDTKDDDVNRFVLHINGVTAVPTVNEAGGIQVFAYGSTLYLHGQDRLNGKVSVFNTLGQKVYEGLLNGAARQQIRIRQKAGIYFVRLEENGHLFTNKVFIQ